MTSVGAITDYFNEAVPFSLKIDFDNVGLLCGFPEKAVTKVLVALDITLDVIQEAVSCGAELIVSHHPIIFSPLTSIRSDDLNGKKLIALIHNNISAICLHTNLDIIEGGVNDALALTLGLDVVDKLPCGRIAELSQAESMDSFLQRAKKALKVSGLRYYDSGHLVHRIALCGGSGGDLIYSARSLGCDTVLTGEVKYNQWLDAKELGINVIDGDHFCTENVVIPVLAKMLTQRFPELAVQISSVHAQTLSGYV